MKMMAHDTHNGAHPPQNEWGNKWVMARAPSSKHRGAFFFLPLFSIPLHPSPQPGPPHHPIATVTMSRCATAVRPLARQLSRPLQHRPQCLAMRPFSASAARAADIVEPQDPAQSSSPAAAAPQGEQLLPPQQRQPTAQDLDPDTVTAEFEVALMRTGKMPVGSRRRRLAKASTLDLPLEQLPYQAFQEARKFLAEEREGTLATIREEATKIAHLEAKNPEVMRGGQAMKDKRLAGLRRYVEKLKIYADCSDPVVKKRFEDGLGKLMAIAQSPVPLIASADKTSPGDMNKPIYRHYAEQQWRSYNYKLITQRIKQFHIVPDVLPKFDPTADVQLFFRRSKIPPGQVVDSAVSEHPPRLRVQVFDRGERLVSLVVLDSDVPDTEKDGFARRCHYLAANIPLSPTQTSLPLSHASPDDQLAVPWLPASSQKGAPYHRLGIYLLEQPAGVRLDTAKLKELYAGRDGFSLKSFSTKFRLTPVGFNMFRTVWDENTADVMARHGLPGADLEYRRTRVYSIKPQRAPKGWEAKHFSAKYRHLYKYTRNIKGLSTSKKWIKNKR